MANRPTSTVYANLVNVRITPGEFVIDFGSHFPEAPNQPLPSDHAPDVRVVMPKVMLPALAKLLTQASGQFASQPQVVKSSPGFQPPSAPKDKS